MEQLRVFSFGGGVQSTACLVLASQGKIDYSYFVFADVGADSENPATVRKEATQPGGFSLDRTPACHRAPAIWPAFAVDGPGTPDL